jgi:hypothetical protein
MAVSYRSTVFDLLRILEADHCERSVDAHVAIAKARTLVATPCQTHVITTVVCNMLLCPSRLELAGDLSPEDAAKEAERMRWWTDGTRHVCVSCKERP